MIKFCKDGRVLFDDETIDLSSINVEDFFIANLSIPIELEEGIRMETVMSNFSNLRDFIYKYFSDYYDRLKPLIESKNVDGKYSRLKVFKKIVIEDGFLNIQSSIDFIPSNDQDKKCNFIGELPIFISQEVVVIEDGDSKIIVGTLKSTTTLLDLLEAIFEDLTYSLTEGLIDG